MNKTIIILIDLLFIILLFNNHLLFGQHSLDSINKIILFYESGHSDWSTPGVYSITEKIEFIKSSEKQQLFIANDFLRIKKSLSVQSRQYVNDTTRLDTRKLTVIKPVKIKKILLELNEAKGNFSSAFILPHLNKPTNKEIFKIAGENDLMQIIEQDGVNLTAIQNFYLLDSFLSEQKEILLYPLISTDSWDFLKIYVIRISDTIKYLSHLSQPLGQPFFRLENSYNKETDFVNLNINLAIIDILPIKSLIRQRLDLNTIKKAYVRWYLKNL